MLHYRSSEDITVVIDDNDPSITYSNGWGNDSSYARYFLVYGSTLHYPLQLTASASISFYGTYITVFGVVPTDYDLKNRGFNKTGPQVQSYQIDGGPTEYFNVTLDDPHHFTNQVFFQPSTTQSDGHHTLVITNIAGMLGLDYFIIVPTSPNIQKIDDASPIITYNNVKPFPNINQADFNGTLHSLSTTGFTASLDFNGNFVAVYGAPLSDNSLPDVSFTLDNIDQPIPTGQSEPSGSTPGLSAFRKQRLSFWKFSTLANGQHNLLITVKQGEFLLDFILIQTSDGAGTGPTFLSQSLTPTTPYIPPPSSTNTSPYGSPTSSGSTSRSPPVGAPSDHTKITSVIVGGGVERWAS